MLILNGVLLGIFILRPAVHLGSMLGATVCPEGSPPAGPESVTPAGLVHAPARPKWPRPSAVVRGDLG